MINSGEALIKSKGDPAHTHSGSLSHIVDASHFSRGGGGEEDGREAETALPGL